MIRMIRALTGEKVDPTSRFNKEVLWSSRTDEWETPNDIFEELDKTLGPFTLDVCATPENKKVDVFFTRKENGLIQDWGGNVCWMNSPYSKVKRWIQKAYHESKKKDTRVVCLLASRTDTNWFHKYCKKGTVWFIKGRLRFEGAENQAPFPSMIVIFPRLDEKEEKRK